MSIPGKFSAILLFLFLFACNSTEKKPVNELFTAEINKDREAKNLKFSDSLTSPLNKEAIASFNGLHFFEPDEDYQVNADFMVDTSAPSFTMATTTDRLPNYRIYGYITFWLKDTLCKLAVYQNVDYKDDPVYGNTLFIPFKDATNGKQSYAAGRYIDIAIPASDSIILDFNTSYNPYCAYDKRWSCPLVPGENWMEMAIFAGEKKFK